MKRESLPAMPVRSGQDATLNFDALVSRLPSTAYSISYGLINSAGEIKFSSNDYTAAKVGTGEYEIKWEKERPSANYVVLLTAHGFTRFVEVKEQTAAKVLICIEEPGLGKVNNEFSFLALGA